jgi:hypothetical protein
VWLLVLNAFLCSLYLSLKLLPVCPTYALLQSGHVSLHAPEHMYLAGVTYFCISRFWRVLLVLSAIFRSVFLNRFVIYVVSFLMYVKDAYFCVWVLVFLFEGLVGCPMVGGLCVLVGNPMFNMMSHMMFTSSSSFCKWYVFNLLCRNLMAVYLCWAGWFEEYGIIVSVKEGFWYMEIFQLLGVLWIVTSFISYKLCYWLPSHIYNFNTTCTLFADVVL